MYIHIYKLITDNYDDYDYDYDNGDNKDDNDNKDDHPSLNFLNTYNRGGCHKFLMIKEIDE
jgi:hypothetical protein